MWKRAEGNAGEESGAGRRQSFSSATGKAGEKRAIGQGANELKENTEEKQTFGAGKVHSPHHVVEVNARSFEHL